MTQDIEDVETEVEEEDLSQFLTDEEKSYTTEEEVEEQEAPVTPDKYAGKTVEEVIEMHKNLEHYLGLPADRRVDKMRQDGLIESPADELDIDDDVELPDVDKTIRTMALNNFKMLNASLNLGLKFNEDGALNYNPADDEQKSAWETCLSNAEATVGLFQNQLKPIQNAISKKGINNEILSLAGEIDGTDASKVLKSFNKIDPEMWKSYSPEIKKFLVQDRAKAVAWDLSQQNKTVQSAHVVKQKHEKPLNQDVSPKIGQTKTAEFEAELSAQRKIYHEQLSNNILTEQDLVDIVNQTRSK
jgi:hypothetical protein